MAANVQYRPTTEWAELDPTPALGAVCVSTESGLVKVGDAATAWASLSYLPKPLGDMLKEYAGAGTEAAVKAVLGLGTITAAGHALIDDADAAAQRATLSVPQMHVAATDAPAATDDVSLGYIPGDLWLRVSTAKLYVCSDNTVETAVWDILN